jgi:protein-S-isoprenylcysteine O-methyltransferase Ste14
MSHVLEVKDMHILDQRWLGILIVCLLASLVVVKRAATGSILERPKPDILLWLVNAFNLFFLLVANPLAAILLIIGRIDGADPTFLAITPGWLLVAVETAGLVVYLAGFLLMGWALISLGKNYQLGGSDPRTRDVLIITGPYAVIRHPMYTAALCIAFGLACLLDSLGCLCAFIIYLLLILLLLPIEEESLSRVYGEQFAGYKRRVRRLVPLFF